MTEAEEGGVSELRGPDSRSVEWYLSALLKVLTPYQREVLLSALTDLLARALEMSLLSDYSLVRAARLPDVYLSQADELISQRVEELGLGGTLGAKDVQYIRMLLFQDGGHASREVVSPALESSLFESVARRGHGELRCEYCGFFFRRDDLSTFRYALTTQYDLSLAETLNPKRVVDEIKPLGGTTLHIDHIVPRAGGGLTRTSNLQVLCEFCNQGKTSYRRGLESVSLLIAMSMAPYYGQAPVWLLRHVCVATFWHARSTCSTCGKSSRLAELTAKALDEPEAEHWLGPWTLRAVCYDCIS